METTNFDRSTGVTEHKLGPTSCLLLASHVHASNGVDLLCFLCQGAAVTTTDQQQVTDEAAVDAFLLAHLYRHKQQLCYLSHLYWSIHRRNHSAEAVGRVPQI